MLWKSMVRVLRIPVQAVRRFRTRRVAASFLNHDSPCVRTMGAALRALLLDSPPGPTQDTFAAIERRRADLLSSDEHVSVVDYGAGSPTARRTAEEMAAGVRSTAAVSHVCSASKSPFWCRLLFELVRHVKPRSCIELGTCVGISASYQAAALSLDGVGVLRTLEGSPEIARIARDTLTGLGLPCVSIVTGPFHETLAGVLEESRPVDYFFNDGHHDHDAVIRYFEQALPFLADGACVVFDDIAWSPGMRRAWATIGTHPRVSASFDLQAMGVVFVSSAGGPGPRFRLPLT